MDFKYTLSGIFFIVFGLVILLFHNSIGEFATRFREKIMNIVYDETVRKTNKIAFLILGLFFTFLGILLILHKIQLR